MFTRTTGFLIVPLWLASMGWLIAHDVWPGLSVQDAPTLQVTDWLKQAGRRTQFAIYNDAGRMGTICTDFLIDDESVQRDDTIWIDGSDPLGILPLRMIISSVFTADGILDEFTAKLFNNRGVMRLHGERFPSDFSFTLEMQTISKSFKIPLADGRIIAGGFNPFSQTADLQVGQRWRMQVFNPIAVLTGFGDRFIPMVVAVTGKETIIADGTPVECFIVQAPGARAWIDVNGAVQTQEVTLPGLGVLRIVRLRGYDEDACRTMRRTLFLQPKGPH